MEDHDAAIKTFEAAVDNFPTRSSFLLSDVYKAKRDDDDDDDDDQI